MTWAQYKYQILSDLYRITGDTSIKSLLKHVFFGQSYQFSFWFRTCRYTKDNILLRVLIYPPAKILYRHFTFKLGISVPMMTKVGNGFYIGHFGGIVVNGRSIIGDNCNISQGVTLGQANRGKYEGSPIVGNNVYIGPGAKIVGAVHIGNNVAIGANCVVTKDVPDNSVVVGIPGRVISENGTAGYIEKTDYDGKI